MPKSTKNCDLKSRKGNDFIILGEREIFLIYQFVNKNEMVFFFETCSDLLSEKIAIVIKKNVCKFET